jgi:hypothetical protein
MTGSRLSTLVLVALVAAILGLTARLNPSQLNPFIYLMTVGAWLFIAVIIRPTLARPRIGALSERTFVGAVIAFLGTVASVIVYNTEHDRLYFDQQTAALLFREAIIAVLLVPTIWLVLFLTGRLGQGE